MQDKPKDGRAILDELRRIDNAYAATIPDQRSSERIDHHRIFLLLYHYSTIHWLEFAEASNYPSFINRMLVEFYLRYRDYVFAPVMDSTSCSAPHWQGYFRQADVYRRRPGHLNRLILLDCGVYAHARYDLAEAIAATLRAQRCAGLSELERELVGPRSDQIFTAAARDFILNCEGVLPEIVLSLGRRSFMLYVHNTRWWLPRFQRWREGAWADAVMLLESGRTIFTKDEVGDRWRHLFQREIIPLSRSPNRR
jgi:uncharacterized protein DUF5995